MQFDDVCETGSLNQDKRLFVYVCLSQNLTLIKCIKCASHTSEVCVIHGSSVQFPSLCISSLFSDGHEIAVVYFRNGYMPQNYVSEQVLIKDLLY